MLMIVSRDRKMFDGAAWVYADDYDEVCVASKFGTYRLDTLSRERRYDLLECTGPFFTWRLSLERVDYEGVRWYRWRYASLRDQLLGMRICIRLIAEEFGVLFR